jgi:hypothetical protein
VDGHHLEFCATSKTIFFEQLDMKVHDKNHFTPRSIDKFITVASTRDVILNQVVRKMIVESKLLIEFAI